MMTNEELDKLLEQCVTGGIVPPSEKMRAVIAQAKRAATSYEAGYKAGRSEGWAEVFFGMCWLLLAGAGLAAILEKWK